MDRRTAQTATVGAPMGSRRSTGGDTTVEVPVTPAVVDGMTDDAPLDSTDGQSVAAGTVRHLTYGQIGERFGMSADAARQLVRRKGWCRSRPNAIGQPVVVAVPEAELTDEHRRPTTDDGPPDNRRMINGAPLDYRQPPLENSGEFDDSSRRSVMSVTVGALRSAVDLLGQQLEAERRRAECLRAHDERRLSCAGQFPDGQSQL